VIPSEDSSYLGDGGPVDHSTITSYWVSPATASRSRSGLPAADSQRGRTGGDLDPAGHHGHRDHDVAQTEADTSYDTNPADTMFVWLPTFMTTGTGGHHAAHVHRDQLRTRQHQCEHRRAGRRGRSRRPTVRRGQPERCQRTDHSGDECAEPHPPHCPRPADVISDTRTF